MTDAASTRLAIVIAIGPPLLAGCLHGPLEDPVRAVEAAQDAVDRAMLTNDPVALGRHLLPEVTRTGPGGVTTNRAQWLAQIGSRAIQYAAVQRCQTQIRIYWMTAVVTGLVDITVVKPETGRELEHNRYQRVYVRDGDRWRLAAHQATRAPPESRCDSHVAGSR